MVALRNSVRSVIAYAKMLYYYGQQMCLARLYLLHRIKILEVRENDFLSEISVLRGISPHSKDDLSIVEEKRKQPQERNRLQVQDEDDSELEIILDTRMINEIDLSKAALRDISRRLEDKKNALTDIEKQMDDVSNSLLSSMERQSSGLDLEPNVSCGSNRVERTLGQVTPNRPRVGGPQIWSPKSKQMDMSQENVKDLLPQGALGSPRGRHGGAPDAAGSSVLGRESCEGTTGVDSDSAPVEQTVTVDKESAPDLYQPQEASPSKRLEEEIPHSAKGKRKAIASPESNEDDAGITHSPKAK